MLNCETFVSATRISSGPRIKAWAIVMFIQERAMTKSKSLLVACATLAVTLSVAVAPASASKMMMHKKMMSHKGMMMHKGMPMHKKMMRSM